MSRPANPSYVVQPFAPDTNYPAGGETWNDNPTKVAPPGASSVGFAPDQGNAAQFHNFLHNAWSSSASAAKSKLDELVTYTGQVAVLNWNAKIAVGAVQNYAACYSTASQRWIVVGSTEDVRASNDNGRTWNASSLVAAVGANENCRSIDVDTAGNAVVGTTTAYVFTLTSADVAAKVSVFAGNTAPIDVVYDPVSGLFSAVVYDGLSASLKTSANAGASWTTRTLPVQWGDFTVYPTMTNIRLSVNKTTGRIVAVGQGSAGAGPSGALTCGVMTSDNGGVTWTDRGTFATAIVSPTLGEISCNPDTGEFLYTIGEVSGTPSGEVWTSADGVTWAKKASLASSAIGHVAPHGTLWAGIAQDAGLYKVVYSVDGGATWEHAGLSLEGTFRGIYAGAGGLLALTSAYAYASHRAGKPALGTLA